MKRIRTSQDTISGVCSAFRRDYQSMENFLQLKANAWNTDELGTYISSQVESDLRNQGTPEQQASAQQRINSNLNRLSNLESSTSTMAKCIQEEIIQRQNYSGKIYNLQMDVDKAEKELKDMENVAKEAKERAQLLEEPYTKTTRWESWFPLGRPLQKQSLPVLLSLALVFLVLALGMFLRLANLEFKVDWINPSNSGYLSRYGIGR